jgi:predicted metalloprotease with PDZ domain
MLSPIIKRSCWIALLLIAACSQEEVLNVPTPPENLSLKTSFYYEINLNDRKDDTFKVRMFVDNLTESNSIFQFPATVPGTYSISNFGRFVKSFKVYDKQYNEINVTHHAGTDVNQWVIGNPEKAYIIEYTIAETFDTPVSENPIYLMAGTSIENDHTLLNSFGVLGYVTGLRERDCYLKIYYPPNWKVGTSLDLTSEGYFFATDYDALVDSPIQLGNLTEGSKVIKNTKVQVYTYSLTNQLNANQILTDISTVLYDAEKFLKVLPVNRYSFLYHFENISGGGALEHNYSSVYVLREQPYTSSYGQFLKNIAAHEFFHIVTPLNIHSEIIDNFNFAIPTPSQHLWLYEGVTEWAAHMMQYRNRSISEQQILSTLRGKIAASNNQWYTLSLRDISLKSYTEEGNSQFSNVYQKGAIVATLLDIRLLELSQGTYGLRELLIELMDEYGKDKAFSENDFFDVIANMTYPEIGEFLNAYVIGNEPLPLREYFDKIGIQYEKDANNVVTLKRLLNTTPDQYYLFERWSKNF